MGQSQGVDLVDTGPFTVGDDVAEYLARIPGCYFLVGAGCQDRGLIAPHHHPAFDLDERSLVHGAEVLLRAALAILAG